MSRARARERESQSPPTGEGSVASRAVGQKQKCMCKLDSPVGCARPPVEMETGQPFLRSSSLLLPFLFSFCRPWASRHPLSPPSSPPHSWPDGRRSRIAAAAEGGRARRDPDAGRPSQGAGQDQESHRPRRALHQRQFPRDKGLGAFLADFVASAVPQHTSKEYLERLSK